MNEETVQAEHVQIPTTTPEEVADVAASVGLPLEQVAAVTGEKFAAAMAGMKPMPDSADDESRTIDCVWCVCDKPIERLDWSSGEAYDMVLDPSGCRLDRLNAGAAVLDSHESEDMEDQVGVVRKAWMDGKLGKATLQFSMREDVTPLWQDVRAGIVQNLSFGAWIYTKSETTPKDSARRQMTAIDWEPFEISVVPVPAVAETTFLAPETGVETIRATSPTKESTMENPETITQSGDQARNAEAIAAEAVKAERQRIADIRAAAGRFKQIDEKFVSSLIDNGSTVEAAREAILNKLAEVGEQTPTHSATVTFGADERDKKRNAMEAAILYRSEPQNAEYAKIGREFAGLSLSEMARECLTLAGVNTKGMSRSEYVRIALQGRFGAAEHFAGMATTSDFPNILANVANKSMRKAYEAAPRSYLPIVNVVSAADFKPLNRVQLSDISSLSAINEHGEFTRTYLSDSKETYSLTTYGSIVPIDRQVIINDNLRALTGVPAKLGQAAANLESDTVWSVFTTNANMADGVALFAAGHSNLLTTNALALDKLAAARAKMRIQKAPKGTILNLAPKFLIVPAALETTAVQLISPLGLAATAATSIVPGWVQSMIPVVEGRLDAATNGTTTWYTAADPGQIDGIEVCYLDGQQGVYIETRQGFDVDGVEIKARLDFAAAAVEYRGLQKSTA